MTDKKSQARQAFAAGPLIGGLSASIAKNLNPTCAKYPQRGAFLPHEGTNDIAWGLIAFESLASYETYRARLRSDPEALENFSGSQTKRFILREERNFVEIVDGTFGLPSTFVAK